MKARPCAHLWGGAYLWITVEGEVEVNGEGHCAINLAQAAAHVLLEALDVYSQQRGTPATIIATADIQDAILLSGSQVASGLLGGSSHQPYC